MSTHTPGPWVSGRDASIEQHRTGVLIGKCQVHIGSFVEQMEEARANARLMAAAPEMLEALEAICKWADDLGLYAERGTQLAPVFQLGKAAIRAARGDQ